MESSHQPCGYADAYADTDYLKTCFVETDSHHSLPDISISFIAGRRGSGKSAATIVMLDWQGAYDYKTRLARSNLGETDQDFYTDFIHLLDSFREDVYKDVWEYVDERRVFCAIWKHLILVSAMLEVVPSSGVYIDFSNHGKVYRFLKSHDYYERSFWAMFETVVHKIASAVAGQDPRADTIVKALNEVRDLLGSAEFRDARKSLANILAASNKTCLVIIDALIDRLFRDKPDLYLKCIEGLLDAVMDLLPHNYSPRLHIKCCIPGEALGNVRNYEIAKIRQRTCAIQWSPRDLFTVVGKRIAHFLVRSGKLSESSINDLDWRDPNEIGERVWQEVFPLECENQLGFVEPGFFYLCRHTHHYPREVISMVNHLLRHANDGTPRLTDATFGEVVHHACTSSVSEFTNRNRLIIPFLKQLLDGFCNASNILQFAEIASRIKESKDAWAKDGWSERELLRSLVQLGFLGVVKNYEDLRSRTFKANFAYLTGEEVHYNRMSIFAIHPMFYDQLQIDPDRGRYVYPATYSDSEEDPWETNHT